MEIKEIVDGFETDEEEWDRVVESEEEEEWEELEAWEELDEEEPWEEVGGGGSGDEVLPGGGAPGKAAHHGGAEGTRGTRPGDGEGTRPGDGKATSHGGGAGTRPGDGETTSHGGGQGTRPGAGEVTRHGGGGEVRGRGGGGWLGPARRALVAGGARVLLYPTVAINVTRSKMERDFHYWDRVDPHVVLGAVPFRRHIPWLKELGVTAVVTLTEPFETMIPKSHYQAHGMENLQIPTPDYSAAPSMADIRSALHFMHRIASTGHSTYVHCKAGRGRSTTVVLCYLMRYRGMSREQAWNHTRSKRPRVALTRAQREAVAQFHKQINIPDPMCGGMVIVADQERSDEDDDADKDVNSLEVMAHQQSITRKNQPVQHLKK